MIKNTENWHIEFEAPEYIFNEDDFFLILDEKAIRLSIDEENHKFISLYDSYFSNKKRWILVKSFDLNDDILNTFILFQTLIKELNIK